MKKGLIASALVAAFWGGVALAQDTSQQNNNSPPPAAQQPSTSQSTQDSWRSSTVPDGNTVVGGQTQEQGTVSGTGGSGTAGTSGAPVNLYNAVDVGSGHYQIRANLPQGPTTLDCVK
jgi:hypothetical protein